MRVLFLCLFLLLSLFCKAQFHSGISTQLGFSGKNKVEFNTAIGAGVTVGYLVNKKLDFQLRFNQWFMNNIPFDRYQVKSINFQTKLLFLKGNTHPYIGADIGYFNKTAYYPFNDKYQEKGIGYAVLVGVFHQPKFSKKITFNTNLRYTTVSTSDPIDLIQISFGFFYFFLMEN